MLLLPDNKICTSVNINVATFNINNDVLKYQMVQKASYRKAYQRQKEQKHVEAKQTHKSISDKFDSVSLSKSNNFLQVIKMRKQMYLVESFLSVSAPPILLDPNPPPNLLGRQFGTVLPRSTSTNTLLLSTFLPSACL